MHKPVPVNIYFTGRVARQGGRNEERGKRKDKPAAERLSFLFHLFSFPPPAMREFLTASRDS
jgi:hypothetical protein